MSCLPETEHLLFFLTIPNHLRSTVFAIEKLGVATASDVSEITHRARAVESHYLNILAAQGIVNKEKKHRKTYFTREQSQNHLNKIIKAVAHLPITIRQILLDDMYHTFSNRIKVFERMKAS